MEQLSVQSNRTELANRPAAPILEALESAQNDLITEDLATFLVAHHILITGTDSISAIKTYFKRTPGVEGLVDELLGQLEKVDLISVAGDKITVKQPFFDLGGNVENLQRFLPRIFKLSAERVLSDAALGVNKAKKEAVRYFALPDDEETAAEAQAIYIEFKAKMLNLVSKADRQNRKGKGVRVVGVFNCAMNPEDFQ